MRWRQSLMAHGARLVAQQEEKRVLICGGGPTGLSTALLLAKYGIPSVIFEKSHELPQHPKAHCINHRTMEVFRGMMPHGLADRVCDAMPPLEQWRSFVYCSGSLVAPGSMLGCVDHFGSTFAPDAKVPYDGAISPEPVAHLPQHRLIPMLVDHVRNFEHLIDFRMNQNVVSVSQQSESVRVEVEGGTDAEVGSYLVAADGAHSSIRKGLGIDMDGAGTLQYLVNIHFRSPALGRRLIEDRRMGMLYFIFGTKNIVVLVAHNLQEGEFVAQVPFFPPLQSSEDFDMIQSKEIIREISGMNLTDVEILNSKPWAMGAAVATRYRHDNILLAGDAAHIVPPSGAFGMNTGIQDAHNLAWKLARILNDSSGTLNTESILQSYEAERKPIAIANMNLSVDNFHEALQVARIIGLDFDTAQSLNSVLNGPWSSWAPESVRRSMLSAAMSSGLLLGQALAATRRNALQELFSSGKTLRLQYPKEDVGFAYTGKHALVHVEPELANAVHMASLPKPRDAPYVPQCLPGHRFFHTEFEVTYSSLDTLKKDTRISSLDVPSSVGTRCALFVQDARDWIHHMDPQEYEDTIVLVEVSNTSHIPTTKGMVHVIDCDATFASYLAPVQDYFQQEHVGVLVRPDGHIAWVGPCSRVSSAVSSYFKYYNF